MHNVLPIARLEPWKPRMGEAGQDFLKMPDLEDPQDEWEVEEIMQKRKRGDTVSYLVKWAHWPHEYDQWVDEEDMGNAQEVIRGFEWKHGRGRQQGHVRPRGRPKEAR